MARFDGKTALVTGAGSGIGEAVAKVLAADGARVIVADIDMTGAGRVAEEIAAAGGTAVTFEQNTADPAANEAVVDFARSEFGGLHLAVNNAGSGGPLAPTGEYPIDGWQRVIDVNLSGVFYGLR